MTLRVVLFGGSGFIGSALGQGLGPDVVAPRRRDLDLLDTGRVEAFLTPGDVVINAAGYAAATDRTAAGLARLRRDNVESVRSLAAASVSVGIRQLIHLSSVAAMGNREGVALGEGDLAVPRSPYGRSKRDAEIVLEEAPAGLPVTILRPTSIFGEGRGLARLLCRVAELPIVPLPAGGAALVPFSYVGNLVEAVRVSLGREACVGRTFIVGDERSYRLEEIIRELGVALDRRRTRILPFPSALARAMATAESAARRVIGGAPILDATRIETLTCSVSYSIAPFQAATGYVPPVSLREAAARIAAWHRAESPSLEPE